MLVNKTCTGCKIDKPLDAFWSNKMGRGGKQPKCKECLLEQQRQRRATHGDRPRMKYVYGLTPEEIDLRLKSQGGVCAICKTEFPSQRDKVIDHCHKTGKFRGVLCRTCNVGIGMLKDDKDIVENALEYLRCW